LGFQVFELRNAQKNLYCAIYIMIRRYYLSRHVYTAVAGCWRDGIFDWLIENNAHSTPDFYWNFYFHFFFAPRDYFYVFLQVAFRLRDEIITHCNDVNTILASSMIVRMKREIAYSCFSAYNITSDCQCCFLLSS
jgi:hypothetical protein